MKDGKQNDTRQIPGAISESESQGETERLNAQQTEDRIYQSHLRATQKVLQIFGMEMTKT